MDTESLLWSIMFGGGGSIPSGYKAYFPFNGNANDESGNGNNGVVYGATLTNDSDGNPNSAYYFDGSGDYIEFGNNQLISVDEAFNIEVKIKIESQTDYPAMLDLITPFGVPFEFGINNRSNYSVIGFGSRSGWGRFRSDELPYSYYVGNYVVIKLSYNGEGSNDIDNFELTVDNSVLNLTTGGSYAVAPNKNTIGALPTHNYLKATIDYVKIY